MKSVISDKVKTQSPLYKTSLFTTPDIISNSRLQEMINNHNIPPFKMPTKNASHIELHRINDPRLPKQIAEALASREDDSEFNVLHSLIPPE